MDHRSDETQPMADSPASGDDSLGAWQRTARLASKHVLLGDGLFALALWIVAVMKGTTCAYVVAGLWTLRLPIDAPRGWARSAGMPGWSANEASKIGRASCRERG